MAICQIAKSTTLTHKGKIVDKKILDIARDTSAYNAAADRVEGLCRVSEWVGLYDVNRGLPDRAWFAESCGVTVADVAWCNGALLDYAQKTGMVNWGGLMITFSESLSTGDKFCLYETHLLEGCPGLGVDMTRAQTLEFLSQEWVSNLGMAYVVERAR